MKVEVLTFFRFLAASIVVVFHYGISTFGANSVTASGPKMVTFFFVLSGFVMGLAYLQKEISVTKYWYARATRILPVYFLALYMMIQLNSLPLESTAVLLNLSLLQSWVSPYPLTVNNPGWSLSVEAFFYLLFPLLLLPIKKYNIGPLKLLTVALLLWLLTQIVHTIALSDNYYGGYPSISHDAIYYLPLSHLCSFLLGLVGAYCIQHYTFKVKSNFGSMIILGLGLYLVYFTLEIQLPLYYLLQVKLPNDASLFAVTFLLLIWAGAICQAPIMKIFSFKPIVLMGEASYSLYILQVPIHLFYNDKVAPLLSVSDSLNFYLYFALLLSLSVCSFLLFERPVNHFLRYKLKGYLYGAPKKIKVVFNRIGT